MIPVEGSFGVKNKYTIIDVINKFIEEMMIPHLTKL